jgi:pilus assembly protein CpaB
MAQRAASSAQGRLNRRFLLVAILLAGLSAALVYARIAATDDSSGGGGGGGGSGDTPVVVARVAIQERTLVTDDMLEIRNVSGNSVAAGAFTSIDDVIGKVTKFPIEINQQVIATSVIDTSRPVGDALLANVIPTGRRGFSIGASQVGNAGGLILPGDWVDVNWACCGDSATVSRTVLRNVQVAAVAQTIVSSGPVVDATPGAETGNPVAADAAPPAPDAITVTLLLTPEEAQIVHLAERNGQLRLELRGPGDTDATDPGLVLITDILPVQDVAALPEPLKPPGYGNEQ